MAIVTCIACFVQLIIAASGAGVVENDVNFCKEFPGHRPRHKKYTYAHSTPAPRSHRAATDICDAVRVQYFFHSSWTYFIFIKLKSTAVLRLCRSTLGVWLYACIKYTQLHYNVDFAASRDACAYTWI